MQELRRCRPLERRSPHQPGLPCGVCYSAPCQLKGKQVGCRSAAAREVLAPQWRGTRRQSVYALKWSKWHMFCWRECGKLAVEAPVRERWRNRGKFARHSSAARWRDPDVNANRRLHRMCVRGNAKPWRVTEGANPPPRTVNQINQTNHQRNNVTHRVTSNVNASVTGPEQRKSTNGNRTMCP